MAEHAWFLIIHWEHSGCMVITVVVVTLLSLVRCLITELDKYL